MLTTVTRFHDISCGHRVVGHEGKCRGLHGHNYRIHFECVAPALDSIGRVVDFGVIKSRLCMWLEDNWDHRFLFWTEDPLRNMFLQSRAGIGMSGDECSAIINSCLTVPFNPTAENMAQYLIRYVAPDQLAQTGIFCRKIVIEETRKCSATVELPVTQDM